MQYQAQSNLWRLDNAIKPKTNGKTVLQIGKSRVLTRAQQVFPFVFFQDEIIVEELRIIWIRRMGPWAEEVVSIMATDIASVNCASGLFFGHIHVQSLTGGPEIMVDNLIKRDVYKIRSMVEGIALSAREGLKVEQQNLETEKLNLMQAGRIN